MKFRTSFVSNSSSASYVVTLNNTSIESFCNDLRKVDWPEWATDRAYQSDVTQQIAKLYKTETPENKKQAKLLETVLLGFGSKTPNEKLIQILKHRGISVDQKEDGVRLGYFTSMHNCFNEGMPELFREVILHFLFELKGEKWMNFEVRHDGDWPDIF